MLGYIIRRVLYAVPILIGACALTFVLFNVIVTPRELAKRNLSARNPTPAQIETWLRERGYDRPRHIQFITSTWNLLRFDFGKSDATQEKIRDKIVRHVRPSLLVAAPTFFVGVLAAVSAALFVAYYRGTYLDFWGTLLCVLLMSVSYLVYIMAGQFVLGKLLKYFPMAGWGEGVLAWRFVMLPMVIGVISGIGASVRFYRTAVLDEMSQDYVRTARAKGVSERAVLFKHVLKNAAVPILTSVVISIPLLLLGSILLESFFAVPGIGTMTIDAIQSNDFALVRAMVYLGTVLYIAGAILTDISYAAVNPRMRLE